MIGSGSGSGSQPRRYKARYVDTLNGKPVYVYNCGATPPWGDKRVMTRLVDFGSRHASSGSGSGSGSFTTRPVYAFASEGCTYPCHDEDLPDECPPPEFVERINWPPVGISRHIKARINSSFTECPDVTCRQVMGVYDGARWVWDFGKIKIGMIVVPGTDPPSAANLLFDTGGSTCSVSITTIPSVSAIFPFRAKVRIALNAGCCHCLCNPDDIGPDNFVFRLEVDVDLYGYCLRRKAARLVDFAAGSGSVATPVYAFSTCRPAQDCALPAPCCIFDDCTLSACFFGGGGCGALDGLCVDLEPIAGIGHPRWRSKEFACCTTPQQCTFSFDCLDRDTLSFTAAFSTETNCTGSVSGNADVAACGFGKTIEFDIVITCVHWDSPPAPKPACCPEGTYTLTVRITRKVC